MAITIKTLKSTSSISADRITLNDNFAIITENVNSILGIVDISTGKIDNSNIGSDNTITTNGITIKESGLDAQTLRQNVTSPKGTTAAALQVFSDNNFDSLVLQAMSAAKKRAQELA